MKISNKIIALLGERTRCKSICFVNICLCSFYNLSSKSFLLWQCYPDRGQRNQTLTMISMKCVIIYSLIIIINSINNVFWSLAGWCTVCICWYLLRSHVSCKQKMSLDWWHKMYVYNYALFSNFLEEVANFFTLLPLKISTVFSNSGIILVEQKFG